MKVRLLRDAKILHKAGEIVEVSPAECGFLTSVGSAVIVSAEKVAKAEPKTENNENKEMIKEIYALTDCNSNS